MSSISAHDPYERKRITMLDSEMAYVDEGEGDPIVFLHGNPTSSYLWRNVIREVKETGRCLAPDLIGMGDSGKPGNGSYRFVDHARYLDAWFDAMDLGDNIVLVVHDWGTALGLHWAHRHADRVRGVVYMEGIVMPLKWDDWPEAARDIFKGMRSDAGEKMVLEKNLFVERILPASVLRGLTEEEIAVYGKPYTEAGESRRPTLTWPREIPIDGEPKDVQEIVEAFSDWMSKNDMPKLFIDADPGIILIGRQREFCNSWPNQKKVTVPGLHFIQEDSPVEIGQAVVEFVKGL